MKKTISLIMLVIATGALVACGSDDNSKKAFVENIHVATQDYAEGKEVVWSEVLKDDEIVLEEPNKNFHEQIFLDHKVTFDERIEKAPYIIKGEYTGKKIVEKAYSYYLFKVKEQYRGAILESERWVVWANSTEKELEIEKGEEAMILASRNASVYRGFDVLAAAYLICEKNVAVYDYVSGRSRLEWDKKDNATYEDIRDYIVEAAKKTEGKQEETDIGDYVKSTKLTDIVKGSSLIAKVKITSTELNLDGKTDCCKATIDTAYKGSGLDSIEILFFKNSVKVGEEYIVLLNGEENIYRLSSTSSVYPYSDEKRDEILSIISTK